MTDQPKEHRREEEDQRLPLTATDKIKKADGGDDSGPPTKDSSRESSKSDGEAKK